METTSRAFCNVFAAFSAAVVAASAISDSVSLVSLSLGVVKSIRDRLAFDARHGNGAGNVCERLLTLESLRDASSGVTRDGVIADSRMAESVCDGVTIDATPAAARMARLHSDDLSWRTD